MYKLTSNDTQIHFFYIILEVYVCVYSTLSGVSSMQTICTHSASNAIVQPNIYDTGSVAQCKHRQSLCAPALQLTCEKAEIVKRTRS